MTRQNAANTTEANRLMAEAEEVIRGADTSMADLRGDMHEITSASEQTRKIIKTIDEIAFQTVTNRSSKVVNLLGEVASASQEQSQGVDQLNRAVADMNNVTQQNAAAAEELSSIMSMFRTDAEAGGRTEAPNPSSASGSQYPCSVQSGSKINQRNLPKPKAG